MQLEARDQILWAFSQLKRVDKQANKPKLPKQ